MILTEKKRLKLNFLIIGLGNPGPQYINTRHNVGFSFIEKLTLSFQSPLKKKWFHSFEYSELSYEKRTMIFVKPLTFMNNSGEILPYLLKKYKIIPENIIIVLDNMDLQPGRSRLKSSGSSAGHNGLKSIISFLNTNKFSRLYIGVGRPQKGDSIVEHVLGLPSCEEQDLIEEEIDRTVEVFQSLKENSLESIRNVINSSKG